MVETVYSQLSAWGLPLPLRGLWRSAQWAGLIVSRSHVGCGAAFKFVSGSLIRGEILLLFRRCVVGNHYLRLRGHGVGGADFAGNLSQSWV
jgi:hypothetical protein